MGIESEATRKSIGDKLKKIRLLCAPTDFGQVEGLKVNKEAPGKGISRELVAIGLHMSYETLTKIEQGTYRPLKSELLGKILDFYGVDYPLRKDIFHEAGFALADNYTGLDFDIPDSVQFMMDKLDPNPAYVMNERWDILGGNRSFHQVFSDFSSRSMLERNTLYFMFADPISRQLITDWEKHAQRVIAQFKLDYGKHRNDPEFKEVVDEIKAAALHKEFHEWWLEDLDIRDKAVTDKHLDHPVYGLLKFAQQGLRTADDNVNLLIVMYQPVDEYTAQQLGRIDQLAKGIVANPAENIGRNGHLVPG